MEALIGWICWILEFLTGKRFRYSGKKQIVVLESFYSERYRTFIKIFTVLNIRIKSNYNQKKNFEVKKRNIFINLSNYFPTKNIFYKITKVSFYWIFNFFTSNNKTQSSKDGVVIQIRWKTCSIRIENSIINFLFQGLYQGYK